MFICLFFLLTLSVITVYQVRIEYLKSIE